MSKGAKEILELTNSLMNQSFEGWSDQAIGGYSTAIKTINDRAKEICNRGRQVPIKLVKDVIMSRISSNEDLLDGSVNDTIPIIGKLKALVRSSEGYIVADITNGNVYSSEFDVYFRHDEYVIYTQGE